MQIAQLPQMIFQGEETIAVDIVVTAGGFGWSAVWKKVIDAKNAQFVRAALVEPSHHLLGVGTIEGP